MKPYRKTSGRNPDGTRRYSPYWWVDFLDASGKLIQMSTKTTSVTEARRILADRLAAVRANGMVFENMRKVIPFQELAKDYLEWHCGRHRSTGTQVKPRLQHLNELLGGKDINKISSEDLTAYRTWRRRQRVGNAEDSKQVSDSTINRELDVLNAAYNWAEGEDKYMDVLRRNPYVRKKHRTKEPEAPTGWFSPDCKQRFMEACDELPVSGKHFPPVLLKSIVQVLWATGMRIEECLTLRKRQVKLDYRLVQLEGKQTKNKKAGDVDLRTDEAFHVFRLACQGKKDSALVFQWAAGDALRQPHRCKVPREPGQIPYSAIASAFRGACAKAGLENLTLHSCRKTAATEMAIEGYSYPEIKEMLHHEDLTTTLRYVNQKAVSEIRRQRRNQLKVGAELCDNVDPSRAGEATGRDNSLVGTTQALHRRSEQRAKA